MDDGGVYTVKATSLLAKMTTVCIVWPVTCQNGQAMLFDESAYSFTHDVSTDYEYEAKDSDPPALKRKGYSWRFMERCHVLSANRFPYF